MAHDTKRSSSRKIPKQARAQATYEAILDGAIRVFDRDGIDAGTTSIAEAAGVSVGTLYQYFKNREEILDALQDREFERAHAMLRERLISEGFGSAQELALAVVRGLLALYRAAPALHRFLAIDGLRIAPTERVQAFDHRIIETLRGFFDVTPFVIKRSNHHAAAFVLYHSVRATLLAAILEDSLGLSDEVLTTEVTALILGHLIA